MVVKIFKTFQFYSYALIQILIEPKRFFTELPENTSMMKSLGFLVLFGIVYTGASLMIGNYDDPAGMAVIFFLNGVGMAFVSACVSYVIMVMTVGRKTGFEMIFSVHAYSSGIILLVSWVSFFFWFTELWKWWLVYAGFRNAGRLQWKPAILILLLTMTVHSFLFFYLYPMFFRP